MIHLVTRWGAIDVQINNNIEILNNAKEVATIMTIQATQSVKDIMTQLARPQLRIYIMLSTGAI